MVDKYQFVSLEDEIDLRRAIRATYKHEGMLGVYKCMGELSRSIEIIGEIALEILDEEAKNKGDQS
jgi:hypothetical protein